MCYDNCTIFCQNRSVALSPEIAFFYSIRRYNEEEKASKEQQVENGK